MFPELFCVVLIDISRIDFCGSYRDDKRYWVWRHEKCGAQRYVFVHRVQQESSKVSVRASSSPRWNRRVVLFHRVPHYDQAFVVGSHAIFVNVQCGKLAIISYGDDTVMFILGSMQ